MRINNDFFYVGNPIYQGQYYAYDWRHLVETYRSLVKDTMTVVEVGSSIFEKTSELARYCKKLIGVDIDATKICRPEKNIEVIRGDWQNLSSILGKNSIDMVVSSHVLEHIPDDVKAVNETYKVLKDNGILLFVTPNRNRLSRIFAKFMGWEATCNYKDHVREYSERDIITLLSRTDFTFSAITGVALGLHSGSFFMLYFKRYPQLLKMFVNFWEVCAVKRQ